MAAYGAAISLRKTLCQLLSTQQIRALCVGIYDLQRFLDDNREVKRAFEIQIRDAIYEAQDVIDSHMPSAHFVSPSEAEISSQSFCSDLEGLIQRINSIAEMTKSEEFNHRTLDRKISDSVWKKSDEINCTNVYPLVGRREDIDQLENRLLGGSAARGLVSIVGIAGMGKTTLARWFFRDKMIREHFDLCGYFKVPIEYKKRDVLLRLLGSMNNRSDGIHQKTDDQLAKHFYNFLKHKRYLVLLDDIRDIEVWDDLKELLPNHHNGSRILITTRNVDIARIAETPHQLDRLSDDATFFLLQKIVFHKEPCPPELASIAQCIADSCRGHPLAVVIVGRLLSCATLSREYWLRVLSSIATCDSYENRIETLVSLTYNHLPQYLRSCLLYMAMFPHDYYITTFKLMHLWIAEGFLKMDIEYTGSNSEIAKALDCFNQLEKRGLIFNFFEVESTVEICKICEEVFHDFGIRTAKEEDFSFIINKDTKYGNFLQKEDDPHNQLRRLFIYKSIVPFIIQDLPKYHKLQTSISTVRSLLYYGPEHQYPLRAWLDFNFLRVLDTLKIRFYSFPLEILKLLQLRYLSLSYNGQLPAEVCKLRYLKFLIVSRYRIVKCSGAPSYLPVEIWNMKELTHLQVMGSDLPYVPLDTDLILENLFSLLEVSAHSCTRQILERIPKLWELGIQIESLPEDESLSFFSHLNILYRLEIFKCVVVHPSIGSLVAPCSIPAFPFTLRNLKLSGCGFPWEYMRVIAALPNLEKLQLQNYAFQGPVWEVKKDEFPLLNFLWLEDVDLKEWILADGSCFPRMKDLIIRHCYKMQKIPDAIGDFPNLRAIEVIDCNTSAMKSAEEIKKKLSRLNDSGEFCVYSSRDD